MTVNELKSALEGMEDGAEVGICVNTPVGWICPDGAVVGVERICCGFDWHMGKVLVMPECSLDISDVEAWSKRKEEGQ